MLFWIFCHIGTTVADTGLNINPGVPCFPGMKRECLPEKAVQTMSFTDEFLEAIRLRSQALNDPPVEVDVPVDRHRLDQLTEFPGNRYFRIYRANPFRVQRTSQVDFQVSEEDTVADILSHLHAAWPDLQGDTEWEIQTVTHHVHKSIRIPPDRDVFQILVPDDLQFPYPVVVALVESQVWYIESKGFTAELEPTVIPVSLQAASLPNMLHGPTCRDTLCPVRVNGQTLLPTGMFQVAHGAYVTIAWLPEIHLIHTITGDMTQIHFDQFGNQRHASLDEVPPQFPYDLAREMGTRFQTPGEKVIPSAAGIQLVLTDWYRWMYHRTGMRYLHHGRRSFVSIQRFPWYEVQFEDLNVNVVWPIQIPQFYATLVARWEIPRNGLTAGWSMLTTTFHVRETRPDPTRQYLAFIEEADRNPPEMWQFLLLEIYVADRLGHFTIPPELYTCMTPSEVSMGQLKQFTSIEADCERFECVFRLDGAYLASNQADVMIIDGSFLQIWMGPWYDPLNSSESDLEGILVDDGPLPASTSSEQRLRSTVLFGRGSSDILCAPPPTGFVTQLLLWMIILGLSCLSE